MASSCASSSVTVPMSCWCCRHVCMRFSHRHLDCRLPHQQGSPHPRHVERDHLGEHSNTSRLHARVPAPSSVVVDAAVAQNCVKLAVAELARVTPRSVSEDG